MRGERRPVTNWSDEETDEPLIADHRNFYKVEKWSGDGERVEELLFVGITSLKAWRIFECLIQKRPRSRLTIRQRSRVFGVVSASTLIGRLRFLGSLAARHSIHNCASWAHIKVNLSLAVAWPSFRATSAYRLYFAEVRH